VAGIWGVPALPIADAGAAAGAAVAAAVALVPEAERDELADKARAVAARPGKAVEPDPKAVAAYRDKGGYLDRLEKEFSRLQL
jgi:sugar (pentulose or hexulose) kinase